MSNLEKSCKNSIKNPRLPFTQILQCSVNTPSHMVNTYCVYHEDQDISTDTGLPSNPQSPPRSCQATQGCPLQAQGFIWDYGLHLALVSLVSLDLQSLGFSLSFMPLTFFKSTGSLLNVPQFRFV